MTEVAFYVIHPNGREKLKADNLFDAYDEFRTHWTAKAHWSKGKKPLDRRLVETRTSEITRETLSGTSDEG